MNCLTESVETAWRGARTPAANSARSGWRQRVDHAAVAHCARPSTIGTAASCVPRATTISASAAAVGAVRSQGSISSVEGGPSAESCLSDTWAEPGSAGLDAWASAVTIAPSGPAPGCSSGTQSSPSAASRSTSPPIAVTSFAPASLAAAATRSMRVRPSTTTNALSVPIRLLDPPAAMAAENPGCTACTAEACTAEEVYRTRAGRCPTPAGLVARTALRLGLAADAAAGPNEGCRAAQPFGGHDGSS